DVAVLVPPIRLVGLSSQLQEAATLPLISNTVESEQVGHVTFFEPDPTVLHAADLGVGRADDVASGLGGDSADFPQAAQLASQHDAQDRGPWRSSRRPAA